MNEMTDAKPFEWFVLGPHGVVMKFDTNTYPDLANGDTVERCMNEYLERYPNAMRWDASLTQGILSIRVFGRVNMAAAFNLRSENG